MFCTLTFEVEKLKHEEEGQLLIAPHAGLQYLNLLLHYFYEFELIHNAYI